MNQFPTYELDELIQCLKPYQSSAMLDLIARHGNEEAARIWLGSNGPTDTQRFGGSGQSAPFWDKFQGEFRLFVCGGEKYEKERAQLVSKGKVAAGFTVGIISSAISIHLGIAATLLSPVVAVMLYIVGKLGINAWCGCDQT